MRWTLGANTEVEILEAHCLNRWDMLTDGPRDMIAIMAEIGSKLLRRWISAR